MIYVRSMVFHHHVTSYVVFGWSTGIMLSSFWNKTWLTKNNADFGLVSLFDQKSNNSWWCWSAPVWFETTCFSVWWLMSGNVHVSLICCNNCCPAPTRKQHQPHRNSPSCTLSSTWNLCMARRCQLFGLQSPGANMIWWYLMCLGLRSESPAAKHVVGLATGALPADCCLLCIL